MRKIKEELKKIIPANLVTGIIRMRKNKEKNTIPIIIAIKIFFL